MSDDRVNDAASGDSARAPRTPGGPDGYPDPAVAPVYPASPVPGDQQATGVPPHYAGYGAPSAFAGPPSTSASPGGLAIAALAVGIGAFLTALIPVLGLIVAIAGVVLGIMALRRKRGRALWITGLVLSGIGLITSVIVTLVLFVFIPLAITA